MTKTVVGLYNDFDTAQNVVRDLADNGFDRSDIKFMTQNEQTGNQTFMNKTDQGSYAGSNAFSDRSMDMLMYAGVPADDAQAYAEGIRRGDALVMLSTSDDQASLASDIMNRYNPIDIANRSAWTETSETSTTTDYGTAGMSKRTSETTDYGTAGTSRRTRETRDMDEEGERHIPVVEEDLRVGKREVQKGGVRVHTTMTEKPVEKTETVRNESVNVQRRPANRPASEADLDNAFQEQTFEVTETDEELVTDKQARVVEDVVINKDVEEHPETVRDTVRRTDVETEDLGRENVSTTRDFDSMSDFRNDYNTRYANSGHEYSFYQPAYQYGYDLAGTGRYRGQRWNQIEPQVRKDWERQYPQSKWDDFKDAIRQGWERVTNK